MEITTNKNTTNNIFDAMISLLEVFATYISWNGYPLISTDVKTKWGRNMNNCIQIRFTPWKFHYIVVANNTNKSYMDNNLLSYCPFGKMWEKEI
jgi:hypothetical protein